MMFRMFRTFRRFIRLSEHLLTQCTIVQSFGLVQIDDKTWVVSWKFKSAKKVEEHLFKLNALDDNSLVYGVGKIVLWKISSYMLKNQLRYAGISADHAVPVPLHFLQFDTSF